MKTETAEVLFRTRSMLGEGPLWHPVEKRLYWLDIIQHQLLISNPALTEYKIIQFDNPVGCFGFRKDGGLVLGTGKGFALWAHGQEAPEIIWNPLPSREKVRMNDGKVDPAGRFWAGSIDIEQREGELYRLDPDYSQHTLLHHIGISNGLGWSPDRKTMYYTDSIQYAIFTYDYDLAAGRISNRRRFIHLPKDSREIVPDGLCVDREGFIWSAHWNGWGVVRYDPDGKPVIRIEVPAQKVTSCCFGGEKLDQLIITTAREGLAKDAQIKQPAAGDVFILQTETTGQEPYLFGS